MKRILKMIGLFLLLAILAAGVVRLLDWKIFHDLGTQQQAEEDTTPWPPSIDFNDLWTRSY